MLNDIKPGDCVRIPDGRIGRVRDKSGDTYKVRIRRKTSKTHQFLTLSKGDLTKVACPSGWMSPNGYNKYLKITLEKMKMRKREKGK